MIPIADSDRVRLMMTAVLKRAIKDYIKRTKIGTYKRGAVHQRAKCYLFEDTQESKEYVFGFRSICDYFGICPESLREKILQLSNE